MRPNWSHSRALNHSCFDRSATQTVPTVSFKGQAWQYRVLPLGLSLSSHAFTKVVEGARTPLRLAYLGPIQRAVVLKIFVGASGQLGKEQALSFAENLFSRVELDSVSMTACLTDEHAQAVLNCLSSFRGRNVVPLKQFQRLLGHMASVAAATPLGLLHMRPLQLWLHSRGGHGATVHFE